MTQRYSFALCLSHDVDRIYKTYQHIYEAIGQLDPRQFFGYLKSKNPYWTFPQVMKIESSLDVRSCFNVLDEIHLRQRPKSDWICKKGWQLFAGRYDIKDSQLASQLQMLDNLGWEIALHGSYTSSANPARFKSANDRI